MPSPGTVAGQFAPGRQDPRVPKLLLAACACVSGPPVVLRQRVKAPRSFRAMEHALRHQVCTLLERAPYTRAAGKGRGDGPDSLTLRRCSSSGRDTSRTAPLVAPVREASLPLRVGCFPGHHRAGRGWLSRFVGCSRNRSDGPTGSSTDAGSTLLAFQLVRRPGLEGVPTGHFSIHSPPVARLQWLRKRSGCRRGATIAAGVCL